MRFSILLPTRDRLELLRYAVESVRRQHFADWEIIVSDNASIEDVKGYVCALADPRIRYVRTPGFVPVTENWNNALANSNGDYVLMLGDDDCLMPGCLARLDALIKEFDSPESVYTEAIQFAYPGVMPGHDKGFVQTGYSDLIRGRTAPSILDRAEAMAAVRKSMRLRLSFSYNMQHSVVSRRLIERLGTNGPFFQSRYPDYYASNVVLLTADRVLVVPEPLVVIGITPKSFGFFYFNSRAEEGDAFLGHLDDAIASEVVLDSLLPGSSLLTSWYLAMVQIERNYGREHDVRVDTRRYRLLQVLGACHERGIGAFRDYWPRLTWDERLEGLGAAIWLAALRRMPGGWRLTDAIQQWSPFPMFDPQIKTVEYQNILDLFEAASPK